MNDQTFLQVQAIQLRQLLEEAEDDPILAPQLRERLAEVEQELQATQGHGTSLLPRENRVLPRTALFVRGGGVQGNEGIRPSLAGGLLIQYERMFTEQALHDEREAARTAGRQRRPRGAGTPGLSFTGTPRGSFGLEFVPQATEDDALLEVHKRSLDNIAAAIILVAGGETIPLDKAVQQIPARVFEPLKQFLRTLAQHDAELRLAFQDQPSKSLTAGQIQRAVERLDREMTQETITIPGVFRGVTRESGAFDLKTDAGEIISGTAADELTEDDLERIDALTNKSCVATLQKTTVRRITGTSTANYLLLDVAPVS